MNKSSLGTKQILPPCWVFYNVIKRGDIWTMPVLDIDAQKTSVSIVLDPYLLQFFSEMQVIILCTEHIAFQGDVYVEEVAARTSTTASLKARSCVNPISNAIKDPLIAALTVVLELKILSEPSWEEPRLYFDLVPNQALAHSNPSACILFARSYPILLNASLSIDIHGSQKFVTEKYIDRLQVPSAFRYLFHVIPTEHDNRNASRFNHLPSNLLLEVAHNVWDQIEAQDAKNIRSMALVCKAWKCVLAVYFQNIGTQGGHSINNIEGLVRSLQRQPEMASHITSISSHRIAPYEGFEGACVDLISFSPFLTHLEISLTIYQRSKTILSEQQNVQVLQIFDPWSGKDNIHTLPEVYTTVRNWTKLVTLKVTISDAPAMIQESPLDAEFRPFSAAFSLEELCIDILARDNANGWESPYSNRPEPQHQIAHLRCFLTATPTLRVLELTHLQNIPNQEMYELLLSLSPTLERLRVGVCTFERADENEEFAVDAATPHLLKIRALEVDDQSATLLSMSRKPNCDGHCQLDLALHLTLDEKEILQALEVTAWSEIRLVMPYARDAGGADASGYLRVAGIEIAERRGIKLILQLY